MAEQELKFRIETTCPQCGARSVVWVTLWATLRGWPS